MRYDIKSRKTVRSSITVVISVIGGILGIILKLPQVILMLFQISPDLCWIAIVVVIGGLTLWWIWSGPNEEDTVAAVKTELSRIADEKYSVEWQSKASSALRAMLNAKFAREFDDCLQRTQSEASARSYLKRLGVRVNGSFLRQTRLERWSDV